MTTDNLFWSRAATLQSDAGSATIARDFVRELLVDHELPELVDDVRLVVSELASLLITQHHASEFTVRLRGGGGEVLLLLQDGSAQSEESLVAGQHTNGYDLRLTDRLSERWGIDLAHLGGSLMWASFAVPIGLKIPQQRGHPPG